MLFFFNSVLQKDTNAIVILIFLAGHVLVKPLNVVKTNFVLHIAIQRNVANVVVETVMDINTITTSNSRNKQYASTYVIEIYITYCLNVPSIIISEFPNSSK